MQINPGLRIVDFEDGRLSIGTEEQSVLFSDLTPMERAFIGSLSEQSPHVGYPGRDVPEPRRSWLLSQLKRVIVGTPKFRISGTMFNILQPEVWRSSAAYGVHAGPLIEARHSAHVVTFGLDRASVQLIATLAMAGVGNFHVFDDAEVELPDLGGPLFALSDLGLPKTTQLTKRLARQYPKTKITQYSLAALHPDSQLPDFGKRPAVAVAMGRDALLPSVRETLMMSGVPHTQVIFQDTSATVGPMVLDGMPGCFDCAQSPLLGRATDEEGASETFAVPPGQLIPDAASAAIIAGLAAQHVLMVLDGQLLPATVGAVMTFHLDTGALVTRSLAPNFACACHLAAA